MSVFASLLLTFRMALDFSQHAEGFRFDLLGEMGNVEVTGRVERWVSGLCGGPPTRRGSSLTLYCKAFEFQEAIAPRGYRIEVRWEHRGLQAIGFLRLERSGEPF